MPDHNELMPNLDKLAEQIKKYFADKENVNAAAKLDAEAAVAGGSGFQQKFIGNAAFVKVYLESAADMKEVFSEKLSSSAISELEQAITKYKTLNPSAKDLCDAILSQLGHLSTSIREEHSKPRPK